MCGSGDVTCFAYPVQKTQAAGQDQTPRATDIDTTCIAICPPERIAAQDYALIHGYREIP